MAANDYTRGYLSRRKELLGTRAPTEKIQATGASVNIPSIPAPKVQGIPASETPRTAMGRDDYTSRYLARRKEYFTGGTVRTTGMAQGEIGSIMEMAAVELKRRAAQPQSTGVGSTVPAAPANSGDISAQMDQVRRQRDEAQRRRDDANRMALSTYKQSPDWRKRWKTELEQAQTDYDLYNRQYNALLNQYYHTENQEKRSALQGDAALSGQYQTAQDLQNDIDKAVAVASDAVYQDGGAEIGAYRAYLEEKYGITQKDIDNYVTGGTRYRPAGEYEGYGNIYALIDELKEKQKQAAESLFQGGYDYERMAGYDKMEKDAAAYQEKMEEWQRQAEEHPVLSSAGTLMVAPFQGVDYLKALGGNLGHNDVDDPQRYVPLNVYNMDATNLVSQVRGTVAKEIEEHTDWEIFGQNVASFLYESGMSIADSSVRLASMGPAGSLLAGGGAAAANQARDVIERGGTNEQAFMGGLAAGAAEVIFEYVSLDKLLETKNVTGWKSFLKETFQQAGVEASEEMLTEISNILSDAAIMGGSSSFAEAVARHEAEGLRAEEAQRQAFYDCIGQVVWAGAGGALSGGVMGGIAGARGYYINAKETGAQFKDTEKAISAEAGGGDLLDRAAGELSERGRVTNSTARDILNDPEARAALETGAGLSITEDMTKSQRRSAVKEAVGRLARTQETISEEAGETAPSSEPAAQAQPQSAALRAHNILRMQRSAQYLGDQGAKAAQAFYQDSDISPDRYYGSFAAYYQAGVTGLDMDKVQTLYDPNTLNDAQKQAAYLAGQVDAANSLKAEQSRVPFAAVYGEGAGLVENDYAKALPREDAVFLNELSRSLGTKLMIEPELELGAEGVTLQNGVIKLSAQAKNPLLVVSGHEITHRLQELAPMEYRAYRDYANARIAEINGRDAVESIRERYAGSGITLSTEQAMDEVAAEFAEAMVKDGELFQDLARENRTVAQKVLDVLKEFIAKVKSLFKGSAKEQNSAAMAQYGVDMSTLEEAARLWNTALKAAQKQAGAMEANENAAQKDGGEARYSLKEFEDGRRFVDVDTDQDRFAGLTTAQMQTEAKKVILQRFRGKVIGGEYTAYVDRMSAKHYAYPANRRMNETQKRDKMQASPELDSILAASTFLENVPDDGRHPSATGGLDKLETLFRVNGRLYQAEITVLVTDHGRVFYDMTKFNDITGRETGQTQSAAETSNHAVKDSIPQEDGDVNTRYSLKESVGAQRDTEKLREENNLLRERVDYWKGQTRRTIPGEVDRKAVESFAKELIRSYGADIPSESISGDLLALFNYMGTGKDGKNELTYTEARRRAESVAQALVESAVAVDDEGYRQYGDLRDYLHTTKLTLSEADSRGIQDFGDFKKRNFGRLRIGKGTTNIDQVYQEMVSRWPEFFDEQRESSPADQLLRMEEVLDSIYSVTEYNPFSFHMEEAVAGAANEIMEGFSTSPRPAPPLPTGRSANWRTQRPRAASRCSGCGSRTTPSWRRCARRTGSGYRR